MPLPVCSRCTTRLWGISSTFELRMDAMLVRFWLLMLFIMEMLEGRLSDVCMDVGALMLLCMVLCMLRADCVRPMVLGWVD